jgi:DNA polymerase III epsilon subunit-like protein
MIEDKPSFNESPDHHMIKKLFENPDNVVVAHNATFDLAMLKKEDIIPANFICTLRVARFLDKEGKIEKYNLQYLRYLLEIEIEAQAHDALGDVLVLEKLFERLLKKVMEENNFSEQQAIAEMIEISSHPTILRTINFGKYNGQEIKDIATIDRGYLEWLLKQKEDSDQIDEDWIYTLRHYLGMLQ